MANKRVRLWRRNFTLFYGLAQLLRVCHVAEIKKRPGSRQRSPGGGFSLRACPFVCHINHSEGHERVGR